MSIALKSVKNPDSIYDYKKRLEALGYGYHTDEKGVQYWVDNRYMEVTPEFADRIYYATRDLWEMCLQAVQFVLDNENTIFPLFNIPKEYFQYIANTWENDVPSIYGRFDLAYDPDTDSIKMLEFNADTPTSLFETAVVQWHWKEHYFPNNESVDQFNNAHDRLVEYWAYLKQYLKGDTLHFACVRESLEDLTNVEYIRDCATQAGIKTKFLFVDEIGWDKSRGCFTDLQEEVITDIFKLYPWEWMIHEEFGKNILTDAVETNWIEPSWKMLLSNKAILYVLSELFPKNPYILKCKTEPLTGDYVKKPLLSREGANVTIVKDNETLDQSEGEYGYEGFIYQEYAKLLFTGHGHYVIGSWVIGQEPCGMSFRESNGLITDNLSRYIPHIIKN